jgi:hypothetical protein
MSPSGSGHSLDLATACSNFKAIVTESMTHAADEAKVTILSDQITVVTKYDILVANAIVAQSEPTAVPRRELFIYVSMPGRACAELLPAGFYTVEQKIDSLTGAPHARFVNSKGKTALEHLPLNRDLVRKQSPKQGWSIPLQFTPDAWIQQTGDAYAQTIIGLHSVRCYERAGWEWWEWVTITIDPDGPV